MKQPIQLSFKEIVSYLCHIEQKAPRKEFVLYETKHWVSPNTLIPMPTLLDEAKNMLGFVGLHNYQTNIKFEELGENEGGNISLNDTIEPIVRINISNAFKSNWEATLAVLAHEICHKFLMANGLYCAIDVNVNETYVDLATMYVGFGELMLNGCDTKVGNTSYKLGYLTKETYQVAYRLACSVLGNISTSCGNGIDGFVDKALTLWRMKDDKNELLKECFVKKSQQMSELSRNLSTMEQLIIQCKQDLSSGYDALDKEYFRELKKKDGIFCNKMAAFLTFFNATNRHKDDEVVEELNAIFNEALYKAFMVYQQHRHIELKQEKVTCPSCGTVGKTVKTESGIVKCPKCYRTFYWKADQWNCTCYQRQLETQRGEEKIRFDQRVQKEVEEKVRDMRKKTDAEIESFKRNEMAICKASIRNSMPWFYRWLASDYLE